MTSTALIILDNAALSASFSETAAQSKEVALASSALIARVTTPEENEAAAEAQNKLADLRRQVEKARKEAKAPVIEFGRKIDAQAEAFIAEVAAEEMRVSKLIGDFFQLQEARRKAAEAAARLEQEAIERRAREEQQRILREEQDRLAVIRRQEEAAAAKVREEQAAREAIARKESEEAARKIREANSAKARAQAEREAAELKERQRIADAKAAEEAERNRIELERQKELAAAKTHDQLDAAQERASNAQAAIAAAPILAPTKAAGQTVKADIEITVTDIHKLYRAHPNCVNLEPRLSDIKSLIQAGVTVQGVTFKEVMKAQARSSRQLAAIEV